MTINITGGVTITGGVNFFARRAPLTRGIDFSMLNGTPRTFYPTVSLHYGSVPTIWRGNTTTNYPVPAGYSFASITGIADWSSNITIDNLTTTISGETGESGIAAYLPSTAVGEKLMYSFTLQQYNGETYWDAIGLSDDSSVNFNTYLGSDTYGISIWDTGGVVFNDGEIVLPYGPKFQADGKNVDLLVDNDTQRMWYSIDGGEWQGNYAQFTLTSSSVVNYDGDATWYPAEGYGAFDATTNTNIDFYPDAGDPLLTRLINAYGDPGAFSGGYRGGVWNVTWDTSGEPFSGYAFIVLFSASSGSTSGYGVYMYPCDVTGDNVIPGTYYLPAKFVLKEQTIIT